MRETKDIVRQITVAASAVFALIGAFVGSGAAGGTPIQNAAGGALAADATLIAPATPAFSVWSVIYLGLIIYAVWQLLPGQSSAERHRRLGYWIAASLVLNAFWILSIQFDLLPLSVPIIVVLLAVLVQAFLQAIAYPPTSVADGIITDATIGLYLGWVCVATAANVTALLVASGFTGWGLPPELWSVVVVGVAAAVGVVLAVVSRGRISPALTLAWGLTWVAVGRLAGEPASLATGIAAAAAAALVLIVTIVIRLTRRKALPA
ncbi:MAG: tryptophan-rich sensory protein [Actinobacteria bacterium]|nr:tryptophan-rich sensory protein [Actinomycetota bacterium]